MNFLKKNDPFIIAEIGNNHEGSFRLAKKLIIEAAKTGVDAVKFQTFQTENYVNSKDKKRFNRLKKFELTKKQFSELAIFARKKKLIFISTPFDIQSAINLNKIVDCFKISSGDNNYFELIDKVLTFKKHTIISTGLLNKLEILNLVKHIKKKKFPLKKVYFLHCVSDYPVKDNQANLLSIKYLKKTLSLNIGYSDHTLGTEAAIVATAYGAKIIEKHFTIDKNYSNFRDHKLSADRSEMTKLVNSVRKVKQMIGKFDKLISRGEKKNLSSMRRSLYFKNKIVKGSKILKSDLKIIRPFVELAPNQINKVLDKKVKRTQSINQLVKLKNIKN
jgi:N,N'-diacetyllegionaminate synthase